MRYWSPDAPKKDVEVYGQRFSDVVVAGDPKADPTKVLRSYEITVVDGRTHLPDGKDAWKFDEHGFCYIQRPLHDFEEHASQDRKRVDREFAPAVVEAVRRAAGAKRAFWMSHQRRAEGASQAESPAVGFSHADYGPSFERQIRAVLVARYGVPEEEARTCGICLANMWAPVLNPAYRMPLAVLDSSTVDMGRDVVPWIIHRSIDTGYGYHDEMVGRAAHGRPPAERVPQAALDAPAVAPLHSPRHRWVYLPDMAPDEAVVFKQWDFRAGAAAKATFHAAFPDPYHKLWQECPGRKSIECRVILTYDPELAARL